MKKKKAKRLPIEANEKWRNLMAWASPRPNSVNHHIIPNIPTYEDFIIDYMFESHDRLGAKETK